MPELELDVQLASNQDQIPSDERLKEWARKAIQNSENETELTIRIVDEDESRSLNLAYRGKDKPTNVLSFPFEAPEHVPMNLLGDLVICAPVVEMEARSQNKSSEAHWAHMVIHGVLHLQGFDHIEDQEAERMETLEIEILNDLGYANPYVEQASQSHE